MEQRSWRHKIQASRIVKFFEAKLLSYIFIHRGEIVYHTCEVYLDYAAALWDLYTQKNIKDTESVQNDAACFIKSMYGKDRSVSALKARQDWHPLQMPSQK